MPLYGERSNTAVTQLLRKNDRKAKLLVPTTGNGRERSQPLTSLQKNQLSRLSSPSSAYQSTVLPIVLIVTARGSLN